MSADAIEQRRAELARRFVALVTECEQAGCIVTVERVPLPPVAMGHAFHHVDVRVRQFPPVTA